MGHQAEVVEYKQIADVAIAIKTRCCSDSTTDSWHTHQAVHSLSPSDLDAWVAERIAEAQDRHDRVGKVKAHLDSLVAMAARA